MAKKKVDKKDEEKPEEKSEEAKSEESKLPKFKNKGKDVKIKLGNLVEYRWITVKTGEVVTIPREVALANKLEEVK